jgi:hypothetical protein
MQRAKETSAKNLKKAAEEETAHIDEMWNTNQLGRKIRHQQAVKKTNH